MNQRVERSDSRPGFIGYWKRLHVRLLELEGGVKLPGALEHPGRDVDADDTYAAIREV